MTPTPARQPQHCDNQRICYLYRGKHIGMINKHRCKISPCSHDTRATHTSPKAPEYKFTCWRGDCKLHDDCIHSYGQEYPPCVDACAMQARTAAAKAAREQVLVELQKWRKEHPVKKRGA